MKRKLVLTVEFPLDEKKITEKIENDAVTKHLPGLISKWQKVKKRFFIYRTIFTVLYLIGLYYLWVFIHAFSFYIDLQSPKLTFANSWYVFAYSGFVVILFWYIIAFWIIKTSPARFSWYKTTLEDIKKDVEVSFFKKKKEIYQNLFALILPQVKVDFELKEIKLELWFDRQLSNVIKGKNTAVSLFDNYDWNETSFTHSQLIFSDDAMMRYESVLIKGITFDLEIGVVNVFLEGEDLDMDFPCASETLSSMVYMMNESNVYITTKVFSQKNATCKDGLALLKSMK